MVRELREWVAKASFVNISAPNDSWVEVKAKVNLSTKLPSVWNSQVEIWVYKVNGIIFFNLAVKGLNK